MIKVRDRLNHMQDLTHSVVKFIPKDFDKNHPTIEQVLSNVKPITIYGYSITDSLQWRPQVREGPTVTYFNKKCYLYGGVSSQLFNDWSSLDVNDWNWKKIGKGKGDAPYEGR